MFGLSYSPVVNKVAKRNRRSYRAM
jgi:hypothetical protein